MKHLEFLTLVQADDCHVHLRDGAMLADVLPHTARQFARAIVMPNLNPPLTTTASVQAYHQRILSARPRGSSFQPMMTLYLTDRTSADEIMRAHDSQIIVGAKLYPAGVTTHAAAGVTDLARCSSALEAMQGIGMPLLLHGEVNSPNVDAFDREKIFIDQVLQKLRADFPALKIVFEHITTQEAVDYVSQADTSSEIRLAATITAHHLLFNRNALFTGGLRPHYYCLPLPKREVHRQALLRAASSGSPRFFLGTDSAPHTLRTKEHSCGCAGCYTALHALELYATAFEQVNALDKLEGFSSVYGAEFYGWQRNVKTVTLRRKAWKVPASLKLAQGDLVPLGAGMTLQWEQQGIHL